MDLRHLLTKVLSRIEVNLRTQITYIVSNHYSENPIWFADTNIMDREFVKTFKKIYKDIRKNNTIIQNHHTRYEVPYAPAWKTLEFVTLGSIRKIFNAIKDNSVKMKIIEVYGINRIDIFDNYLKAIVDIRNACSHTRVIFDFRSEETIKVTKIFCLYKEYFIFSLIMSIRSLLLVYLSIKSSISFFMSFALLLEILVKK